MTTQPEADALVLFGATGDLSQRKLYPALYHMTRHGHLDVPVIGVARSDWDDETYREFARAAVMTQVPDADEAVVDEMTSHLQLVYGDYGDPETFRQLASVLDEHGSEHAVFYLAIPPSMFEVVIGSLREVGLADRGRVVVEKPFGRDLASAVGLNEILHDAFPEERIFRIDHYLGKESVEDLLVFRFSNAILEPIWNRNYVASVQVTMAETIGVEGRGAFYDTVGAIRDVVQNHLLQVVALLAMEPPVGPEAHYLQDERAKVFACIEPCSHAVRGQYDGYLDEKGVSPTSTTETFAAMHLHIDSWRWAGVPWYVRAGKALAENATEVVVEFHQPPRLLFDEDGNPPEPNLIRFRLGRRDGVIFTLQAKTPGRALDSQSVDVRVDFAAALGERRDAYERLLDDALAGNPQRFARQDVVEETWRIVEPLLGEHSPAHVYERGSWGPEQADDLMPGGWYPPSD